MLLSVLTNLITFNNITVLLSCTVYNNLEDEFKIMGLQLTNQITVFHMLTHDIVLFSAAAYDAVSGSYFGHGDLPMLLGYAGCNGREAQVANCSGIRFNRPISQSCDNTRVAGVRCLGTQLNIYTNFLA